MFWPIKMEIRVVLMSTIRFMNRTQDSHSMTISNISLKATGPIVTKSHLEPPGADGKKICSNCIVHMKNMHHTHIW